METHPFEKKKFPWLYSEIQFLFLALKVFKPWNHRTVAQNFKKF